MDKLLVKGEGWLAAHPERELIARRYLKYRSSLAREAILRLAEEDEPDPEQADGGEENSEQSLERPISLNEERLGAVVAALKGSGARRVLDLGCGEGRLLRDLLAEKQFDEILGMDVSIRCLETAADRLRLENMPPLQRKRIELIHGSLMYRDKRLHGFDAAAVVEVIEHMDQPRLSAFERALFEFARPATIVLTTPNREYNVMWENVGEDSLRHRDHRFEWTREQFETWATRVAEKHGYTVRFLPIGTVDAKVGPPTQMGVFTIGEQGTEE